MCNDPWEKGMHERDAEQRGFAYNSEVMRKNKDAILFSFVMHVFLLRVVIFHSKIHIKIENNDFKL